MALLEDTSRCDALDKPAERDLCQAYVIEADCETPTQAEKTTQACLFERATAAGSLFACVLLEDEDARHLCEARVNGSETSAGPAAVAGQVPGSEEDPCQVGGSRVRASGAFLAVPQGWEPVTNSVALEFDTACPDVDGSGERVDICTDSVTGETSTATSLITFEGRYDPQAGTFNGTVWVEYDTTGGGCVEPYSFDYPATWNGTYTADAVTGWLDGFGDFRLDDIVVTEDRPE